MILMMSQRPGDDGLEPLRQNRPHLLGSMLRKEMARALDGHVAVDESGWIARRKMGMCEMFVVHTVEKMDKLVAGFRRPGPGWDI